MNINNSVSFLSNNENGTVTLFAVPFHLIQQSPQQQQSLIVEENVIFKTLPDGSIVLDTNQLLNSNSVSNTTDVINNRKCFDSNELILTLQPNDENIVINQPNEVNNVTDLKPKIDSKSSTKIRFLNKKSIEVRKVGRPRKDTTKVNNNEIDKKGPFICKFCKKEFDKWLFYKRHEKSHVNEKKYKCTFCPASFNILSNCILHSATHNTDDPTCPECGKKFQRIASLKAHLMHHEKEENFHCEECDFLFENEVEINEHLKLHGQEKKEELESLKCRYCQMLFNDQTEFKKHISEHSKMRSILQTPARKKSRRTGIVERKHQCNVCSKAFQKRSQIERHMRVHSGEKPFVCKVCNRGFSQKGSLQIHMSRHTGVKPHKCTLCQAKFSQKGNLRAHILKTHSISQTDGNVYCCSECSCVFKRLGSLNGHMTRNHPKDKTNDIKYVLSQLSAIQNNMSVDNCNTTSTHINTNKCDGGSGVGTQNINTDATQLNAPSATATYVTLHGLGFDGTMRRYVIKQRKVGDIRWHLCSYCPKEFKKPSDLVRHLRVHTREKPYLCKFCNRAFAIKSTLTTHLKTHTKCTTVECKYCHKYFSSWNSLNAHILKHTGFKQKCNVCNKIYRSKSQLTQHMKSHVSTPCYKEPNGNSVMLEPIQITSRGLEPVSSLRKRPIIEAGCKTRPYTCKVCGGGFRKLSHLKQHHVLIHTRERPYSCSHCFRNFGSISILKSHLSTHNGARPYQCPVCQKTFSAKGSLKRHMVAHSNTKPFICPYCFLDFKTLVQCKKHIGSHTTTDFNLHMEIDENCDIGENEFVDNESTELTNVDDQMKIIINESENCVPLIEENDKNQPKNNINVTTIDENRANLSQEFDDNLNSQMLSIIGSENFIDSSTYINNKIDISQPIATTDELVNTLTGANELPEKQIEDNPFLYQQVIVNLNPELPMFDSNGIDNIVSNLKLQNDSLFLTDLNTLNMNESNNVLLPFQINPHPEIQQNQLIVLPSEDIQTEIMPPINTAPVALLETIDPDLQLKINNMNRYFNSTDPTDLPINETSQFLNVEEHVIPSFISKSVDTNILTDVLTNAKQKCDTDNNVKMSEETACNMCKVQFKNRNELKVHQCIHLLNVEIDESNLTQSDNNDTLDVSIGKDKNLTQKEFLEYVTKKVQSVKSNGKTSSNSSNTVKFKNQCSYCPKSFRKPSDLQRHVRTHTGERPFKCSECDKSFSLKSTLESHFKIHEGKKDFTCLVCNCSLSSKGSLNLHMRLHTGAKPYKCPLCLLRFRTSGHLKAHLTVHYKEVIKTGKISTDGITRKTKMAEFVKKVENLITANINSDQNEKVEERCEINLELNENMRLNPCIEDDNIDLRAEDRPLNMHFEIETNAEGQIVNIKPTASNILFIDEASKKEVASTQVEFDAKTKLQIENFLRDKKDKQEENKNRMKKVCPVCNKEFSTKYLLDRHSKIHTGEKLFSCNFCTKAFNQKSALQIHTRTHFGSRPYSCPHCSNNFSQIGNLKTHIKRIHSGLNVEQPTSISNSEFTITDINNIDITS